MMRSIGFGLIALAGLVAAQTPVGFKPAVEEHLVVKFSNKAVNEPGTALTKAGIRRQHIPRAIRKCSKGRHV